LLRAHGSEITIRELMSDSSGLIDDNDVFASPSAARAYLARVGDPRLRAQLLAVAARIRRVSDFLCKRVRVVGLRSGF
jgi:hypothetical protein